jgi:hypothetical protein
VFLGLLVKILRSLLLIKRLIRVRQEQALLQPKVVQQEKYIILKHKSVGKRMQMVVYQVRLGMQQLENVNALQGRNLIQLLRPVRRSMLPAHRPILQAQTQVPSAHL